MNRHTTCTNWLSSAVRRCRGAILVDAALLLPVVILLMVGMLEIGRLSFGYAVLTHAVREGARQAAVKPALEVNDPVILAEIEATLRRGGLASSAGAVTFTFPLQVGRVVRVSVDVEFSPVVSVVFMRFGQNSSGVIPLHAETVTTYEI